MPKKFSQKLISNRDNVFAGRTNNIPMNLGTLSATTSPLKIVAVIPRKGTITGVDLVVNTTITANDTNYWTFALTNKGTDGTGTTVLLAATDANTTKATGGIGLAAYDTTALTLSSTTADLNFNAGDVITLTATKAVSASNLVDLTVNLKFKDR